MNDISIEAIIMESDTGAKAEHDAIVRESDKKTTRAAIITMMKHSSTERTDSTESKQAFNLGVAFGMAIIAFGNGILTRKELGEFAPDNFLDDVIRHACIFPLLREANLNAEHGGPSMPETLSGLIDAIRRGTL
jgi:hypothetical protein